MHVTCPLLFLGRLFRGGVMHVTCPLLFLGRLFRGEDTQVTCPLLTFYFLPFFYFIYLFMDSMWTSTNGRPAGKV